MFLDVPGNYLEEKKKTLPKKESWLKLLLLAISELNVTYHLSWQELNSIMPLIKKDVYVFMMKEQFCVHRWKNERLALLPLPYYVAQKQSHFLNNLPHATVFLNFRPTSLCIKNLSQWFVCSHTHIPFYKILCSLLSVIRQKSGREEGKTYSTGVRVMTWTPDWTPTNSLRSYTMWCCNTHFLLKPLNLLV